MNFFYLAVIYLVFVVYGSLVPLSYEPMPLDEAWFKFKHIRYLKLGVGSRADWVANILLFIPLAFLWTGTLSYKKPALYRFFCSLFVWICSVALCVSIEFTQLFFPPRTVSLNDIFAESLGAVIGIISWWVFGNKLTHWLTAWREAHFTNNQSEKYLQLYILGLLLYNIMPLDLTISPIEIFHQWREGKIILIPFSRLKAEGIENLYEWLSEIALWIPVPVLWARKNKMTLNKLLLRVFLLALTIEFLQIFVFSRVTDVTDIVLAMTGSGLSIMGLNYFSMIEAKRSSQQFQENSRLKKNIWALACYIFWCLVLMLIFWYPYDFHGVNNEIRARVSGFYKIPFYSYYFGTEFRAITEVFHKILFFLPIGGILAFSELRKTENKIYLLLLWCLLIVPATIIEVGQLFLPEKVIDSTDILLAICGAWIGFKFVKQYLNEKAPLVKNRSIQQTIPVKREFNGVSSINIKSTIDLRSLFIILFILIGVIYALGLLSAVPYNIRELIGGSYAFLRAFGAALAIVWCCGFPVWFFIRYLISKNDNIFMLIGGILVHTSVAWLVIRMVAPMESIHDIVGSPILNINSEIELLGRFFALYGVFSIACFGAVFFAALCLNLKLNLRKQWGYGIVSTLMILPLCYWVVVHQAATDNLIELLAEQGRSLAVSSLFFYLLLLLFISGFIVSSFVFKRISKFVIAAGLLIISFPIGYTLLWVGTEEYIFKYGQIFSALQFLLSANRENLVSGYELWLRFGMAHFGMLAILMMAQTSIWVAWAKSFSCYENGA